MTWKIKYLSTYERLKWTFTLYDLNKDGYITKQEVMNVMVAVHELMGIHACPLVNRRRGSDIKNHMI